MKQVPVAVKCKIASVLLLLIPHQLSQNLDHVYYTQGRSSLPGEGSPAGDRENEGNTSFGLFAFQIFPLVLQWELNEQMQPHEALDTAQLAIRHNTHFMQDR